MMYIKINRDLKQIGLRLIQIIKIIFLILHILGIYQEIQNQETQNQEMQK